MEELNFTSVCREKSRFHENSRQNYLPTFRKNSMIVTKTEKSTAGSSSSKGWKIPIPVRLLMLVLAFMGFNCLYALRVNLSVAIVAMTYSTSPERFTDTKDLTHNHNATSMAVPGGSHQCPPFHKINVYERQQKPRNWHLKSSSIQAARFNWSETVKSQILAAFFYGYIIMQLPASYLAERFGAHRVFGAGILCTAILTLLTPLAANTSPWALFALRFLEGLFEGVIFPAMHVFWSYWAPVPERTRLVGICYCGAQFGTIFAVPFAGVLAKRFGWPSIFYAFGAIACAWSALWFTFSAHSPRQSRWITHDECAYIEANTDRADQQVGGSVCGDEGSRKRAPVPWRKFARSTAVYAVSISHFGVNWAVYTYITELPSYMNNVLKFSSRENVFLSALPYVAMFCMQVTASISADKLRNWKRIQYRRKNTVIRRTFNALGLFSTAVIVCCMPLAGCDHAGALTMLVLSLGFIGFCAGGYEVNHVDIACEYAGALMGISNTLATIPGFVVPALVAWTAGPANSQTISSWSPFFYISTGVFTFCGVINCLFTRGERLPWMDAYVKQAACSRPLVNVTSCDHTEDTESRTSREPKQQLSTVRTVSNVEDD